MGGGDKATPTTPPLYQGGSVDDYTPPAVSPSPVQGFDWSAFRSNLGQGISQGFQSAGQRLQAGAGSIPGFAVSQATPTATPTATPEAMQRFQLEPGSGGQGFLYVDRNTGATPSDPMAYYQAEALKEAEKKKLEDSLRKIGFLPEGTTPSF